MKGGKLLGMPFQMFHCYVDVPTVHGHGNRLREPVASGDLPSPGVEVVHIAFHPTVLPDAGAIVELREIDDAENDGKQDHRHQHPMRPLTPQCTLAGAFRTVAGGVDVG